MRGKLTLSADFLTGRTLKDPNVMVSRHKDKLGQFSNAPVEVSNDLAEIIKLIH